MISVELVVCLHLVWLDPDISALKLLLIQVFTSVFGIFGVSEFDDSRVKE